MNYLIDTCVISELIKSKPNASCIKWMKSHDNASYFISVLTIGEIKKGISKLVDSNKRVLLEEWYEKDFIPRFQSKILPIDEAVAARWGELLASCENAKRTLPTIDSLIGATAISHNLAIVTRNIKDFMHINVQIIDPWVD